MIVPIWYMWEQLNGPQIQGISTAIYELTKSMFDNILEYFNHLSVDTANTEHLTLLGLLSGLVRPLVYEPNSAYFLFTEDALSSYPRGFSSLDQADGGKFSPDQETVDQLQRNYLSDTYYRPLLKAWCDGDNEIGGLALLDDICEVLTRIDRGEGVQPFYQFTFMEGPDIPTDRSPGDVYIDIGNSSQWRDPFKIYGILQGIRDTIYVPQPRLFISLHIQEE